MKKRLLIFSLLFIVVLSAGTILSFTWNKEEVKVQEEIKWMSYDEATKLSKKKKKKIFVDVYTDWCGYCKKMDATTMKDPRIIAYMNKKYYAVKLDAESARASNYKGMSVTERELALRIFKANSYPTTLYLDENEKLLTSVPGFREAEELDKILHFFGENRFETQTWEQFVATYVAD
jgi:thioredoxin-related protein